MEGKFTHYLITRYNVHLDQWDHDRSGGSTHDAAWMKHRESLFRRYCFPSVISQSNQQFTWLLYVQEGTSSAWIKPLLRLTEPFPHIQVRLVDGYWGCMQDIDQQLQKTATPFVITSRLDNDDAIGKTFIETIQQHFAPRHNALINLTEGLGYQPDIKVLTRLKKIQLNHFSSYIETHLPLGGHISVRGFQHGAPPAGCEIINVTTSPIWLKLFHDRNLKSRAFGYPLFSTAPISAFGIAESYLSVHFWNTISYTMKWMIFGLLRKIRGKK